MSGAARARTLLFYAQGLLYCLARFGIEFFRWHPAPPLDGLFPAQWACLAGFLFFAAQLTRTLRGWTLQPAPSEPARAG